MQFSSSCVGECSFGVPQQAGDILFFVNESFYHAVVRGRKDYKTGAQRVGDPVVVGVYVKRSFWEELLYLAI